MLGKLKLVLKDWSINSTAIDMKTDSSHLEEKSFNEMQRLPFSSKLDWGPYIKTTSKNIGALIPSLKFPSPEVAVYLCKSTIWPCM